MSRDRSVWILLGLLLLLVLPSVGLLPGPSSPDAYLRCVLLLTAFFVLAVGPFLRGAGPLRPLALLVAALPFIAYGVLESATVAGTRPVPGVGFWVLVSMGMGLPLLPRPLRGRVAAVVLSVVAGGVVLLFATVWAVRESHQARLDWWRPGLALHRVLRVGALQPR